MSKRFSRDIFLTLLLITNFFFLVGNLCAHGIYVKLCAHICHKTQYYNNYNLYYRESHRHQQVCACLHSAACSSAAARAIAHTHAVILTVYYTRRRT